MSDSHSPRPTPTYDTRQILNAVSAARADLDQMQRDIDRIRISARVVTIVAIYALAMAGFAYYTYTKGVKG